MDKKIEIVIGRQFPAKIIPLIDSAKRSISIIVFDWRWYPDDPGNPCQLFNASIVRAKNRGVEIKVISNIPDIVKRLNELGIKAKKLLTPKLVHVKMMIIDEEILIIGSHNYTQNAFTMNYEVSIILENKEKALELVGFFNNLFN